MAAWMDIGCSWWQQSWSAVWVNTSEVPNILDLISSTVVVTVILAWVGRRTRPSTRSLPTSSMSLSVKAGEDGLSAAPSPPAQ